jgi:uracil-DNA glycosylase family 4
MKMPVSPDEPYALQSFEERQRRHKLLEEDHIKPLTAYLNVIREQINTGQNEKRDMPYFDPCDGGINARVLLLLEAPGPKATAAKGSGFISRNNPDQTAKNLCDMLQRAGVARRDTLIWNIVPWYVGTNERIRAVNQRDIAEALPYLKELIEMLPNLEVIVLVERKSQSEAERIRAISKVPIMTTFHPSPLVCNTRPDIKKQIQEDFCRVAEMLRAL